MKKSRGLWILVLSLALFTGCGAQTDPEKLAESITDSIGSVINNAVAGKTDFQLNKKKITLRVGETFQLKAPGVSAADVKWSSDNKKVVSVTSQGVIRAKKKGTAKITATVDSVSLSCKVKVVKADKPENNNTRVSYDFRRQDYLTEHYRKHGIEMGFESEEAYLDGANAVINDPEALHKLEAEDQDHVYFKESTGEIVFLSQDGYIRTYFIADKDYYDRQ
ncbi:MAG: Ig-like domain-containing protein [Eubacterium sp.]|nr:Ig-like domain-containing protein [Eubacterium sp.]